MAQDFWGELAGMLRMLTISSEKDAGGFSENQVAFQRFLGNMEPRER